MNSSALGKKIQERRVERGMTQADLAQKVDLTPKYLSNLECGFRLPRLDTFIDIANALEIDANTLLTDYLDQGPAIESSGIALKLEGLSMKRQRSAIRIIEIVIKELSETE